MSAEQLKQELIRLMRSRQPQTETYLSNASKGYSYLEIDKTNQKIEIPLMENFAVTRSTNF